jgi:hypothetical protein
VSARNEIENEARRLAAAARRLFNEAAEFYGGRCSLCRSEMANPLVFGGLPKAARPTPEGECCPMRHFVGLVNVGFRIAGDVPIRRKNAIERRLWAMFPGARDDLKVVP